MLWWTHCPCATNGCELMPMVLLCLGKLRDADPADVF